MKKFSRHILSIPLLVLTFASTLRADWPMFQLDEKHSASRPQDILRLPLVQSWSLDTQSSVFGFASAVISDKKVYFGSIRGELTATEWNSGAVLWKFAAQGSIYLAPAAENTKLFFGSTDGNIYVLDSNTGKLLRKFEVGSNIFASPVVSSGTLFIAANNGDVLALKTETGEVVWRLQEYQWS